MATGFPQTTLRLRLLLLFLQQTIAVHHTYDVVVYDGSSGGVTAAVAAARNGHRTALLCGSYPACFLDGGQRVGGLSSGGLGQTDIGPTWPYIGGLAREFYHRNRVHYGNLSTTTTTTTTPCRLPTQPGCNEIAFNLEPHVARSIYEDMLNESHVDVYYGAQVQSVRMKQTNNTNNTTTIETVTVLNGTSFSARIFVDASYEGDLMNYAGVTSVVGREARSHYNESLAGFRINATENQFSLRVNPFDANGQPLPLTTLPPSDSTLVEGMADKKVQSYNFRLCVTKVSSNMVPFPKPFNYQAATFELLRRYLVKCAASNSCELGIPSCNTQAVPSLKYDMNNCGGLSSDFIGGSSSYPDATFSERKVIWQKHLQYQQGLLYYLSNDPGVPIKFRLEMEQWGLCADEFQDNLLAPHW